MPRRLRFAGGGYAYHVLNRAVARDRIFAKSRDYEAFEEVLVEAKERISMRVLAWYVMPTHWHLAMWPHEDGDLSEFMRWMTVTHTQRWHAAHRTAGTGPLYQGRFKSFPIEADDHLWTVLRYVERNALPGSCAVCRGMALVQPLAPGPWRRGSPRRGTAALAAGLATARSVGGDRGGVGGTAAFGGPRNTVWRGDLARAHGETPGSGVHSTGPWPTAKASSATPKPDLRLPTPFPRPPPPQNLI